MIDATHIHAHVQATAVRHKKEGLERFLGLESAGQNKELSRSCQNGRGCQSK